MKIGILAYHSVCNYGAFLQLLSTIEYLRKNNHSPIVINWYPKDLEKFYEERTSAEVRKLYEMLRMQYYPMTLLCRTSEDVANVIVNESIEAVIVGSDAVNQHHTLRERILFPKFPKRKLFHIIPSTSDRTFPNPFWGEFNNFLSNPIPTALISGSSQDSQFNYIKGKQKKQMSSAIKKFSYYSVRDEWTQKMISYLTDDSFIPKVTPDPVFAFNQNAGYLLPPKEEILSKFSIPEKYYLLGFKGKGYVSQEWITEFETRAKEKGIACVILPFPDSKGFGQCDYNVTNVLSPIDWYSLIKYSQGYVGNNMHPIVVSLHNCIPFFSFDYYGIVGNDKSSKVYHILKAAQLSQYRVFTRTKGYRPPMPDLVLDALQHFDHTKLDVFSKKYSASYNEMMEDVLKSLLS